jgi:hypothetical protein
MNLATITAASTSLTIGANPFLEAFTQEEVAFEENARRLDELMSSSIPGWRELAAWLPINLE